MPQMKGLQGWVNGWVNVNNNHVVFPKGAENQNEVSNTSSSSSRQDDPSAFRLGQRDSHPSQAYGINESTKIYPRQFDHADGPAVVGAGVGGVTRNNRQAHGANVANAARPSSTENSAFYKPGPRSHLATSRMRTQRTSKLLRTNSHSDLLKEKAFSKREGTTSGNKVMYDQNHNESRVKDDGRNKTSMMNKSMSSGSEQETAPVRQTRDVGINRRGTMNSSNITMTTPGTVTIGLSTSSIGSHQSRSHLPVNTGQYINENAFANQHHTKKVAAQYSLDNSGKNRRSSPKKPPQTASHNLNTSSRNESIGPGSEINVNMSGQVNADPMIPMPANVQPSTNGKDMTQIKQPTIPPKTKLMPKPRLTHPGTSTSRPPGEPPLVGPECNKCIEMNKRVLSLEADIEYLRCAALNSEYVCVSCEKRGSNNLPVNSSSSVASGRTSVKSNKSRHSSSVASNLMNLSIHSGASGRRKSGNRRTMVDMTSAIHENMALAESSQRLLDVTLRHKRQIEHMSKETARWQNDMHLKLSKLAMMCKDLNDESAKRKEQVNSAKSDLETVREERDVLTSELDILKTRVALYEKQEAENVEIRRVLRENDNETLSMADRAIIERDDIINDLTTRLQQALTSLEEERGSR